MILGWPAPRSATKGSIEQLPSGALRISVYAGIDPVTGRRHYLKETVEPGPRAERDAEAARRRLVSEVAERRSPRTAATVDQLLDRYLDQLDRAPNTLRLYRGYVRNHISPFLGHLKVGQLDAEVLDSFYAELRRCRAHCSGRRQVDHRTSGPHECDHRCGPHKCRPLGPTTVRHMHFILSGAFQARGALAVGVGQPDRPGRAARVADAEPGATDAGGGRADRPRGVAGPGVGRAAVGGDDHRSPARRTLRDPLVVGRTRPGSAGRSGCARRSGKATTAASSRLT